MAMSSGSSSGGVTPNINVTPLIDVLLVLLIIFMVITPMKPHRFEAKVPAEPKPDDQTVAKPNPLTLVVAVNNADKKVTLNKEPAGDVSDASPLTERLSAIFKERESQGAFREGTNEVEKTVFIKSPRSAKYGEVVRVLDAVKQAGAQPIGLQIDDLEQ
ncbi:MAG: biopolymer transporter ExbD [Acidobacteria bacterium]|jgi:biopolymer transport protein ExbD|nr:biopolymer transporter ExbD [Acidobacteriota bacterium]